MSGRRGFALIAALWLLVAISSVGLELSLRAKDRRLAVANRLEAAGARAAAEAGVEHVHARLERALRDAQALGGAFDPARALDPWAAGRVLLPDSVVLGGARYRVTLRDAGALLHLNRAGEEELRRLLVALRVDAGRADRIAQSVADWRDADDLHRARGAEREHYLRAGAAVLPRNGPFQSIGELRHVNGVTPEVYRRVSPYLTLAGSGRVNLNAADRPVLLSLPGIGQEAAELILRLRRRGRLGGLADLSVALSPGAREALQSNLTALMGRTTMETRELELVAESWTEGGRIRARAEALAVRTGGAALLVERRVR